MILYQPLNGYAYNSDSLILANFALEFVKEKDRVIDIGCGVGVVGLAIAKEKNINLTLIDKQKINCIYSKINAKVNKIEVNLICNDFLKENFSQKFNIAISNPPFFESSFESKNKHLNISRYSKHLPLDKLLKKLNSILLPKGEFIFCYDARRSEEVFYLLKEFKFQALEVQFVYPKKDREASLILIRSKKSSKSKTKILPPIFVFEENDFTYKMKNIYKRLSLHSIKASLNLKKL